MIDDMYFVNVAGIQMHWNENPTGNGYFAVEEIHFTPEIRTTDRNRMQGQGQWPTTTYFGKMAIDIQGHILADDSTKHNNYKFRLLELLMPLRVGLVFDRQVGTFFIKYTGQSEYWYTDCGLEATPDIPTVALYPSVSACHLQLKSFLPFMYGANSGAKHWVA